MARPIRTIPEGFGDGDYVTINVTVDKYPKIQFEFDEETGELKPSLKPKNNPVLIQLPILIDPNGINVVPVNLFIRSLVITKNLQKKSLDSYVQALLSFYRWLAWEEKTIYDVTDEPENGVVYGYRDFLLENLKREIDGNVDGIYTPSTAANYVRAVVKYYEFLRIEQIVKFSKNFNPFTYNYVRVRGSSKKLDHDVLGHIKKGDRHIDVQTTGLTKPFGKVQPVPSHHKLTPMHEDEKRVFYEYLNIEESTDALDLMLYLATEVGLRREELVSFPISEVQKPIGDVVKVTISEVRNGCLTKYDKERTIEISAEVMERLNQYKLSKARKQCIEKTVIKHNCLFVKSDGYPYALNTIQTHFSAIRKSIRETHLEWYFTVHDLRATFATHWLHDKQLKTGLLFDVLLDDLANLMGHVSTESTEKYIKYMNNQTTWIEFSGRKNAFVSEVLEG